MGVLVWLGITGLLIAAVFALAWSAAVLVTLLEGRDGWS